MKQIRLILILTYFNMRARYRKTWAGFIWVIASPVITFIVQAFIFKSILKLNISEYPFYLLTGLMPWFFISQSFNATTSCLVHARELLLGVKVNPLIIVGTQILDQFFNFLVVFFLILTYLFFTSSLNLSIVKILLLGPSIIMLFGFVFLSVFVLSFWHVFYRDIQYVVQFVMNLAFFVTPIFYSVSFVPVRYQWIFKLNIFIPFVKMFQDSLYNLNINTWLIDFSESILIVSVLAVVASVSVKKKSREFYTYV